MRPYAAPRTQLTWQVLEYCLFVQYEGEWPIDGGITGGRMTVGELIALAEKIRGTWARNSPQCLLLFIVTQSG